MKTENGYVHSEINLIYYFYINIGYSVEFTSTSLPEYEPKHGSQMHISSASQASPGWSSFPHQFHIV